MTSKKTIAEKAISELYDLLVAYPSVVKNNIDLLLRMADYIYTVDYEMNLPPLVMDKVLRVKSIEEIT